MNVVQFANCLGRLYTIIYVAIWNAFSRGSWYYFMWI